MKIVDIKTKRSDIRQTRSVIPRATDTLGPEHDVTQTLLTIVTDEGAEGYALGAVPPSWRGSSSPRWLGKTHSIVKSYGNGSSTGSESIETSQTM